MAVVPFVFADSTGPIPLSQLDVNFANVKAFAETAGNITGNIQANITSLGTLTSLTVSGNVTSPYFLGNISGNLTVAGSNTQVLFNDNGLANATSGMTFNKATSVFSVSGNVLSGNLNATGKIFALDNITSNGIVSGSVLIASTGNIGVPAGVTTLSIANGIPDTMFIGGNASNIYMANVNSTTRMAGNITAGGSISATGTVTGGNVATAGTVSATGTVTGGNVATAGTVSATGTVTGGNVATAGTVSATGNIQGGNVLTTGSVSVTGNLTVSGNAVAVTVANGTSTTQLATTAFVNNSLINRLPTGVITLWYGSIVSIPTGWALCDGGNGTPDLRNRFVVGAGSTYAVAATGGSANAVVVSHTHTANSSVSDPGHSHGYVTYASLLPQQGATTNCWTGTANASTTSNTTGITVSTTVDSAGVSGTNANLPPYYALAYIMKL
jgi:hypothetical protein